MTNCTLTLLAPEQQPWGQINCSVITPDPFLVGRQLLSAFDFTYLGSYLTNGNGFVSGNLSYGRSLTHRYVASQLNFLSIGYGGSGGLDPVYEFTLPAGGFSQLITNSQLINNWTSIYPTLSAPLASTVNHASSGGTVASGTYQVVITYTTTFGETNISSTTSVTTTTNFSTLTIVSPAAASNIASTPPNAATGWNAYVTQVNGSSYTLQNSLPIAIGTDLVITAPPTFSGNGLPWGDGRGNTSAGEVNIGGGDEYNIYWDEGKGGLWMSQSTDYPSDGTPGSDTGTYTTSCVTFRKLNASGGIGTISNYVGFYGFDNIGQRAIPFGVRPVPASWQSTWGFKPYFYGFGTITARVAQGLVPSIGLMVVAAPDVTDYPSPTAAIPVTDFDTLADHRSGINNDWFIVPGNDLSWDRGIRTTNFTNYTFNGGDPRSNPLQGTSNVDVSGTSVTWNSGIPFQDWWPGYTVTVGGSPVSSGAFQVVINSISYTVATVPSSSSMTLTTSAGTQTGVDMISPSARPVVPPSDGAQWLSPTDPYGRGAPDGKGRWTEEDTFDGTAVLIDGPNKYGLVVIASLVSGFVWYSFSTPNYDGCEAQLQIFDPADLARVKTGTLNAWNVEPTDSKVLNSDLTSDPFLSGQPIFAGRGGSLALVIGATFDSTTNLLWLWLRISQSYTVVLSCYSVNC